ncbi:MAG: ATP-binding cassette domain-containing protein [Pseudonocardia sp.]
MWRSNSTGHRSSRRRIWSSNRGEFVGLAGPNGSGKSTSLRTLYRASRPAVGTVHIGGDDV